jgi:serine/threonine-protein kinase
VLLTDFGIARRIDDASNLTNTNIALGTINYVAPEQLLGKPLDGRADQYALAATTFHLLTGSPVFQDPNPAVIISHHLGTTAPRISERRPDLAHLDDVLARALSKDPTLRYPTCMEFARALTRSSPRPHSAGTAEDSGARPTTQRLERLVVRGTARGVQRRALGAQAEIGLLSFHLVPFEPVAGRHAPVPVEIQTALVPDQLTDGDEVEVSGIWDGDGLDADTIVNISAGVSPKRRRPSVPAKPAGQGVPAKARKRKWVPVAALLAVIAVVAAALLYFTTGGPTGPGPIVKPENATVFSPGGSPDNPQDAGKAIDGDPITAWSTVTYRDAVPFPTFIEGQGLMLHLSEPTALSAVTVDISSTGTEVQIRSSPTEKPAALSDTTELTPTTTLKPGENRIEVDDQTKTSNVLVWISKLGTTDGQSRTEISEITLQAAG